MTTEAPVPFELEILSKGIEYQRWLSDTVRPYLGSRILELGAGIGNLSKWLPMRERLILTEGEPALLARLQRNIEGHFPGLPRPEIRHVDFTKAWEKEFYSENLDTIVSFNVLEHITEDEEAIRRQLAVLRRSASPGPKRWVAIVPAHNWAYGSIDRSYGHYRRYSAKDFDRIRNKLDVTLKMTTRYLNLLGLPGWVLMGKVLQRQQIGSNAVRSFERICPWVRDANDFLHQRLKVPLGQSLLCVLELPSS